MNLEIIALEKKYDSLLQNDIWQKADFYDLDSNSNSVGRALILTLDKKYVSNAEEALIYLIQKQTNALEIWEKQWIETKPTIQEFLNFYITEKGFSNIESRDYNTEIFYENFSKTISALKSETSFECIKNGTKTHFRKLFLPQEIIAVTCFDDTGEEQNFLIATKKAWVLFHWASVV